MIVLTATVTAAFVPDGAGAMEVPSAQSLAAKVVTAIGNAGSPVVVPGGNAPSTANMSTALSALATQLGTFFNTSANNAIINGWASGGG